MLFRSSDVVVQPSIIPESLPTVLLEAMAHSCIVVSSDIGGSNEIITDGKDGFIVPHGNPSKLSEKIIEVVSSMSNLSTVRENAAQTIRDKFSAAKYISNMESWLDTLSYKQ